MNIILVYVELKPSQTAVLRCNDDGTYTILINTNKPRDQQIKGVLHEIAHIKNDDFYSDMQAGLLENMAHNHGKVDIDDINFYCHVL